ncbi:MAG: hypothetical protein RBU27_14055, partial [Bacteroidota bacterium]|nr:hypothetical protein [Bacteroidota bacterium]
MRFFPWLLLLVLPGGLHAQLTDVETLDPPRAFIRNAGQWASVFEYGLLENGNAAMISREGITFYTRSASLLEARAVPVEVRGSGAGHVLDIARVRFLEPSKRMRLRARDTSDAVAHFYRGTDRARWYEQVSNHRRIAYEQVWTGIDAIMENGPSGCRLRFDL